MSKPLFDISSDNSSSSDDHSEFADPLAIDELCAAYRPGYLVPRISMPDAESERAFKESTAATRPITVYALEGTHGAGKTTLGKILRSLNFHLIEEDFIDVFSNFILPDDPSHNCLVEIAWASMQIINLVNMANNIRREILMDPTRFDCFFIDRCFLTGYLYGEMDEETKAWYLNIFNNCIKSLREKYNINFKIVRIKPADSAQHFQHIQHRLEGHDGDVRTQLHEAEREHFERINAGYDEAERLKLIDYIFESTYTQLGGNLIAVELGKFFKSIKDKRLTERYKGLNITYDTEHEICVGFRKSEAK